MTHNPLSNPLMDDEEEDVPSCPLCLEELDATDRAVEACQCGYQVCLWCLHHIREQLNSRCPACRTPYQEQNFKYAEVNHEEAAKEAKERATAKKERERREKIREIERERARAAAVSQQKAKNNLKHARILQKNLVYVIGLSLTLAREDIIRRSDMFGKFGRLTRILVNRAHPFNTDAPGGPSISAYVQYGRDSDASAAVRTMNNAVLDGREIRCAIATTKYCDIFVRNAASSDPNPAHFCGNHNCMYYHSLSQEATLSREEVLARQLGPPPPAHLFLPADTRRLYLGMRIPHSSPPPSGRPIPLRPVINAAPNMAPGASAIHHSSVALPNSSAPIINPPLHSATTPFPSPSPPSHPPPLFVARKPMNSSPQRTPPSSPPASQAPQVNRSPRRPEVTPHRSPSSNHSQRTLMSPSSRLQHNSGWNGSVVGQRASQGIPRPRPSVSLDDAPRSRIRGHPLSRESAPPGFEEPSSPSASSSALSRPPGFDAPKLSNLSIDSRSHFDVAWRENGRPPSSTIAPPPGFGPGPALEKDISSESKNDFAAAWSQKASSDQVFLAKPRRATGGAIRRVDSRQITRDGVKSRSELAQVLAKIGGDLGVSSEIHDVHTSLSFHVAASKPGQASNATTVLETAQRPSTKPGHLDSLFGNHLGGTAFTPPLLPQPDTSGPTSDAGTAAFPTSQQFNISPSSPLAGELFPIPRAEMSSSSRRSNSRFGFAREDSPEEPPEKPPEPAFKPVASLSLSTPISMMTPQESWDNRQNSAYRINGKSGNESLSSLTRSSNSISTEHVAQPSQVTGRQGRSRFDFADQGSSPPKTSQMLRPADISEGASSSVTPAGQPPPKSSSKLLVNDAFIVSFAQLSREEKLASLFNPAQWSAEQLPPMPFVATRPDSATQVTPSSAPVVSPKGKRDSGDKALEDAASNCQHSPQADRDERVSISTDSSTIHFTPPGFREAAPGKTPEKTVVEGTSTSAGVATTVASGGVASTTPGTKLSADANHGNDPIVSSADSLEEEQKRNCRSQRKRDKKARQVQETNERSPSKTREPVLLPTQPLLKLTRKVKPAQVAQPARRHAGQTVISIQPPCLDTSMPSGLTVQAQSATEQIATSTKQTPSLSTAPHRLQPVGEQMQKDPGLAVVQSKKNNEDKFMSVPELEKEVEAARAREAHLQDKLLELQRRIESYDSVRT